MQTSEDIRNLPIDITYSRLGGNQTSLSVDSNKIGLDLFFFFFSWIFYSIQFNFDWIFEEWLVDRKRIPADWRKRLAGVRTVIAKEFASLPKEIDPYFQTLDSEG